MSLQAWSISGSTETYKVKQARLQMPITIIFILHLLNRSVRRSSFYEYLTKTEQTCDDNKGQASVKYDIQ